jgi:hypothetical protein
MNKQELELATHILASNFLAQLKKSAVPLAQAVMTKFDRGPKPAIHEIAKIQFSIDIPARAMYEIEEKVKLMKDGQLPSNNNNRFKR